MSGLYQRISVTPNGLSHGEITPLLRAQALSLSSAVSPDSRRNLDPNGVNSPLRAMAFLGLIKLHFSERP